MRVKQLREGEIIGVEMAMGSRTIVTKQGCQMGMQKKRMKQKYEERSKGQKDHELLRISNIITGARSFLDKITMEREPETCKTFFRDVAS